MLISRRRRECVWFVVFQLNQSRAMQTLKEAEALYKAKERELSVVLKRFERACAVMKIKVPCYMISRVVTWLLLGIRIKLSGSRK